MTVRLKIIDPNSKMISQLNSELYLFLDRYIFPMTIQGCFLHLCNPKSIENIMKYNKMMWPRKSVASFVIPYWLN